MAANQSALRWSGARARACSISRAGSPSEAVAVLPRECLGFGEEPSDRLADRFRVAHGGRSEPARLPEQGVDPEREERQRDPEGDRGAPARPPARRLARPPARFVGRGAVAGKVPKERARDVGLRLLLRLFKARLPVRARVPVVPFDLRETGPVGGEGRGAPIETLGGRAADEGPDEKADAGRDERGGEGPEQNGQSAGSDPRPAPTSLASRLRSSSVSSSRAGARLRIRRSSQARAAAASTNGPHHRSAVAASKGGR